MLVKAIRNRVPQKIKGLVIKVFNLFLCNNNLLSVLLKIRNEGGNMLQIESRTRMKDCRFKFKGSGNRIIIGERCVLNGLRIMLEGDGNSVMIGNVVIVGCPAGIKKRNVRWVHKKL